MRERKMGLDNIGLVYIRYDAICVYVCISLSLSIYIYIYIYMLDIYMYVLIGCCEMARDLER